MIHESKAFDPHSGSLQEYAALFSQITNLNYLDITFPNSVVRLESEEDFRYRPSLSITIGNPIEITDEEE